MKKHYNIKRTGFGVIISCALVYLTGCEAHMSPFDYDEKMLDIIYERGFIGYSDDSVYTELVYDGNSKNIRIMSMRKGIIKNSSGTDVIWKNEIATLRYSSGNADIVYSYNGMSSSIVLNEHYFAESVINRYDDGRLHSIVNYTYNTEGYLDVVSVERPGETGVFLRYKYPNLTAGDYEIIIEEHPGPTVYRIPLAIAEDGSDTHYNDAYVCNVLRYGKAPITNDYVINPDLYYLGLYGKPCRYLPDEMIEKSVQRDTSGAIRTTTITRVGNSRYYYY
ncbi:MAG: hypothetical protein LBJ23_06420 [Tannerella sp.]|jgi:hypothetical protein|nr:hypothetical protein [Tannerella sp.]